MSATTHFWEHWQVAKSLDGVIKALQPNRSLFLSSFMQDGGTIEKDTINFDTELSTKNVMGRFLGAEVDAVPLKHSGFGHVEYALAYTKEAWALETNFTTLNTRMLGDPLGQVNILSNQARRLAKDFALAEERIQNLFELTNRDLFIYGGYFANGEGHIPMVYDFGRSVVSTAAVLTDNRQLAPSANLTTTAVNAPWVDSSGAAVELLPVVATSGGFTAGDKSWSTANIDAKKATPYEDIIRMVMTSRQYDRPSDIIISADAYAQLEYDITKNHAPAASLTDLVMERIALNILPIEQSYDGLDFMRALPLGGGKFINIWVYRGIYHDRKTGVRTNYWPDGWVVVLPATKSMIKFGRIQHPKANFAAMPRWINFGRDDWTGKEKYEMHTAFAIGHMAINSIVSWKVL